ncbi:prepilin-type N-terminal cleavage/methylation domain-containing protein [Neobacillus niacini]|uniref:type IV pilus modification PilV family protein n=1 Tax=Neobacillus niacini TaxID=86668 RepID=UPI002FFFED74
MEILKGEKGVTLVEVLASITLLSIVLITLMNIFPQMGMMNNYNKMKTQGINTAKEVLLKWQNDNDRLKLFFDTPDVSVIPEFKQITGNVYNFEYVNGDFIVRVDVNKNFSKKSDIYNAHLIVVKLYNIEKPDTVVSETYGYVKIRR